MQSTIGDEIWMPIKGFEGRYEVSNMGRIKSCGGYKQRSQHGKIYNVWVNEFIMKLHTLKHNYKQIILTKDNKRYGYLVHRLVAEAFIPNTLNKPEVNHIDRDPSNNCVTNLEWVTKLENMRHAKSNGWNPRLSRLGKHNTEEQKQRYRETKSINKLGYKKCRCIETGQIFQSGVHASQVLGICSTSVYRSIATHRKIKGLYTIELIEV